MGTHLCEVLGIIAVTVLISCSYINICVHFHARVNTCDVVQFFSIAGGVYRAEKHTGANLKMLVQGLSTRPMGIIAFSSSRQKCMLSLQLLLILIVCLCVYLKLAKALGEIVEDNCSATHKSANHTLLHT